MATPTTLIAAEGRVRREELARPEFAARHAAEEQVQAFRDQRREEARATVKRIDTEYWALGRIVAEILRLRDYLWWGEPRYTTMAEFAERDLQMPAAKLRRIAYVVRTFGAHEQELEGVGWTTLSEALPIVKRLGMKATLALARQGFLAVRAWKDAHRSDIDPTWKWLKVKLPPDVYELYEHVAALVQVNGLRQGATFDPKQPWRVLEGIFIAAKEPLEAEAASYVAAAGGAASRCTDSVHL